MKTTIEDLSKTFRALGDPSRLTILHYLKNHSGALCVTAIANMMTISQSAVSQHLRILKDLGLIRGNRVGTMMHYYIDGEVVKKNKELFAKVFGEI